MSCVAAEKTGVTGHSQPWLQLTQQQETKGLHKLAAFKTARHI